MPSFNKVILMGNLTRDPEIRSTPAGMSVVKFSIATSRKYKTKDGEQREEATFVDIEAWGKQAETIAQYFSKGKPILLEGRLKLDQWEEKSTGQKRSKLGVVLEGFTFVGSRDDGERATGSAATTASPAAEDEDENIPF